MKTKHIEVEGCIVNIHTGLVDRQGRKVVGVEIIPDDRFKGERIWKVRGCMNNRVVQLNKIK